MVIFLFKNKGQWDWADRGTSEDIPVEISWSDYQRLQKMERADTELEDEDGSPQE